MRNIKGVTVDTGIGSEGKGLRLPGTHVPGFLALGTFFRDGIRTFWSIRKGEVAVNITLSDFRYDRIVVEVEDPHETVTTINKARQKL